MSCPIPENEAQRLAAVLSYAILDTPPEVDFDALTRVAAHSLNTPAAVVGLMDSNRLWFKSRFGLDAPQLDREIAFCAHAIMRADQPLIVEDLAKDPRFVDNPLVTQAPFLRFYAGAPLVDSHGYALGTIAVADVKPREFGASCRAVLQDLSTLVMTALESRRRALMLGQLALTDYLTGLRNRVEFDRALESEMARAARTGEAFAIMCLDLDGFKAINDQHGHAAGDEVLSIVSQRLKQTLRLEDLLARLGGDEFGVIVRDHDQASVIALAQRIDASIASPIQLSGGEIVNVGISAGVAVYANSIKSTAELLSQADQALYQAKRRRRKPS